MYKAVDKWLVPYVRSAMRRPSNVPKPVHVLFAVCDHYEPLWPFGKSSSTLGQERVQRWIDDYPRCVADFTDADGCHPKHTFFFPEEEYEPAFLKGLEGLVGQGLGEVEIHLHHRHDTAEGLQQKLTGFRDLLHTEHGFLGADADGTTRYGFVHGNWTLCNSRPDGDWCGVNEELGILSATGCYADFTFPSVPSPTQPRMVNAIYYAQDTPGQPRGHDRGREAEADSRRDAESAERGEGKNVECRMSNVECRTVALPSEPRTVAAGLEPSRKVSGVFLRGNRSLQVAARTDSSIPNRAAHGSKRCLSPGESLPTGRGSDGSDESLQTARNGAELLLVQGPLALNWGWRKWGVLPRIEHSDVSGSNPPTPARADLWVRQHIHVRGRPDWVFVKVHTHGCQEKNMEVLLGEPMRRLHGHLTTAYNDGEQCRLHYVTTREMVNIIRAAEAGADGDPGEYRDFEVKRPG